MAEGLSELFGGPDLASDLETPDAASWDHTGARDVNGHPPTPVELEAFDNLVNQCMLSAQLSDGLALPCKQGIFRSIFGVPLVTHSVADHLRTAEDTAREVEPAAKRARTGITIHGLYDRAISFSNTLTDPEIDKNKWARALEKRYTIFTIYPQGCPQGMTLDPDDMQGNFDKIRQL